MNRPPPSHEPPDDVDARYRRASAFDPSGPGEAVRRAVLSHAARMAAERAAKGPAAEGPRQTVSRSWGLAVAGTLAAAAFAGLAIAPRFMAPRSAPAVEAPSAGVSSSRVAGEVAVPVNSPAASSELQQFIPPRRAALVLHPRAPSVAASEPTARLAEHEASAHRQLAPSAATSVAKSRVLESTGTTRGVMGANEISPLMGGLESPETAFRRAAATGDLEALRALMPRQSSINARDADGRTALMLATLNGRTEAVAALLAGGADPDSADGQGRTPLEVAKAAGESDIVATLVRYGARE
ncbi:MAG: ankyrin repeat domain-containing protein [Steroidobacteraceae bacterium]